MLYIDPALTAIICVLAGVLGACMGSFLNCMAWRIVHGESVVKGRSHCDVCGHVLGPMDLIPIISYLIHRGRCPYCKARFSARHLVVEAFSAAAFVGIVLKYGYVLETIEYLLFACILIGCACADIEGYIIPDRFIIAGAVIRLVFILISGDVVSELIDAAIGGIGIAAVMLGLVLLYEKIRGREAMGGGDIKLLCVTGLFLGWKGNILNLILACILGIIFGIIFQGGKDEGSSEEDAAGTDADKQSDDNPEISKNAFPWGPSIAVGAFIVLMVGDLLINAYIGLF